MSRRRHQGVAGRLAAADRFQQLVDGDDLLSLPLANADPARTVHQAAFLAAIADGRQLDAAIAAIRAAADRLAAVIAPLLPAGAPAGSLPTVTPEHPEATFGDRQ